MLTSRRSSRKLLVERSFCRIRVSLCCTRGSATTCTIGSLTDDSSSEDGAVAHDGDRGDSGGAQFRGDRPPGRPTATLEQAGQRQRGGTEAFTHLRRQLV